MDQIHYKEMEENLNRLLQEHQIQEKKIYLFGHCNATEELADLLMAKGFLAAAILDNNTAKHNNNYRGIKIISPKSLLEELPEQTIVCIAARAYAAMADQLNRMGYRGQVRKLVDYNSYAEYSLSPDTLARRRQRVERGVLLLRRLEQNLVSIFSIGRYLFCNVIPSLFDAEAEYKKMCNWSNWGFMRSGGFLVWLL